jgi:hypothetical protein
MSLTKLEWQPDNSFTEVTKTSEYIVVSGSNMPGLRYPETYIFLGDDSGEIIDYLECDGSFQGSIDHALALKNAGYTTEDSEPEQKSNRRLAAAIYGAKSIQQRLQGIIQALPNAARNADRMTLGTSLASLRLELDTLISTLQEMSETND